MGVGPCLSSCVAAASCSDMGREVGKEWVSSETRPTGIYRPYVRSNIMVIWNKNKNSVNITVCQLNGYSNMRVFVCVGVCVAWGGGKT